MAQGKLNNIEARLLKALAHNDRATTSELASMLPDTSDDAIEEARAKLERSKLIEPVPGSPTGQFRLTAEGADTAVELPATESTGSGGGDSAFS